MDNLSVMQKTLKENFSFCSRSLANSQGNTVLAVLSATIVLGVFLQTTGFGGIIESSYLNSNTRLKASRDAISYQLERYAALPASFRNSLRSLDNPELRNCILGNGTSTSCQGDGTHEYPLNLYSPASSPELLAAAHNTPPVLYDTKGNLCQTGATSATWQCPFEAHTTFTANCPALVGSPCPAAESIQVHYVIRIPETLVLTGVVKEKILLNAIDKFAVQVPSSSILPPPYGYVANNLTKITLVTTGQESSTTTYTPTYEDALAIATKITGGNQTLAKTIVDRVFDHYEITDLSLLGAFASFWLQNSEAADAAADELSWRMNRTSTYLPTATNVNNIANVVSKYSQPPVAIALAYGLVEDPALAQMWAGVLGNIPIVFNAKILIDNQVKNQAVAEAVSSALAYNGLNSCNTYCSLINTIAVEARNNILTNAAILQASVAGILTAKITAGTVIREILTKGITDLQTMIQMAADYDAAQLATKIAATSNSGPGSTSDNTDSTSIDTDESTSTSITTEISETTSTSTATSTLTPVTTIQACSSSTSCDTSIGM